MVERDNIGGTCINVACIPTKRSSAQPLLTACHAAGWASRSTANPGVPRAAATAQGVRRRRHGGRARGDVHRVGHGLRAGHGPLRRRTDRRDHHRRRVDTYGAGPRRRHQHRDGSCGARPARPARCRRVDVGDDPAARALARDARHRRRWLHRLRVRVDVRRLRNAGDGPSRGRPPVAARGPRHRCRGGRRPHPPGGRPARASMSVLDHELPACVGRLAGSS